MAGEVGMLGRGDVDCCAEMMGPVPSIHREERQRRGSGEAGSESEKVQQEVQCYRISSRAVVLCQATLF